MPRPLLLLLLGLVASSSAAAQVRLEGLVVDRTTGVPVAQVHVQDEDGRRGSVTNENGRFRLEVEKLPVTLTFRHISYAVQRVAVREPGEIAVRLAPAQITLGELLVVGEDFAPSLIARVIRKKQQMRKSLETVASAGYTRLRLERQGEIVLLSEAVFDAYWDARRGIREVIYSRRESADFYTTFGFEATGQLRCHVRDVIFQGVGPARVEPLSGKFVAAVRQGPADYDHPLVDPRVGVHTPQRRRERGHLLEEEGVALGPVDGGGCDVRTDRPPGGGDRRSRADPDAVAAAHRVARCGGRAPGKAPACARRPPHPAQDPANQ